MLADPGLSAALAGWKQLAAFIHQRTSESRLFGLKDDILAFVELNVSSLFFLFDE